ncbi:MAG: D-alanyl-D-alanine endopeptidase [Rubrivivax sp.]
MPLFPPCTRVLRRMAVGLACGLAVTMAGALPAAQAASRTPASPTALSTVAWSPSVQSPSRKGRPAAKPQARQTRKAAPKRPARAVKAVPPRPTVGQAIGLHDTPDPLSLRSSVALVVDQQTNEVLFSKNPTAVLPIASITKLMTALVVAEAGLPMEEMLTVSSTDELDTGKHSSSRLHVGARLSRGEMMHLALMASENRAALALGRHYPGGLDAFVAAMNRKAAELGMSDTRYVEPTGLSSANRSSAKDLAVLVRAAMSFPIIRDLSVDPEAQIVVGDRALQYRNTNGLIRNPEWSIGLQKTGFIAEAGRCVVMQAELAGRQLIMVLLDSAGRYARIGDAERLREWLLSRQWFGPETPSAGGADATLPLRMVPASTSATSQF